MPVNLVIPQGEYEIPARDRELEDCQEYFARHKRSRFYVPPKKMSQLSQICIRYMICYTLYYSLIAVFTIGYYVLLFRWQNRYEQPYRNKSTSLSFAPFVYVKGNKYIRFISSKHEDVDFFAKEVHKFIQKFGTEGEQRLKGCNRDGFWGYSTSEPCIILKLNFAYGFAADTYWDDVSLPETAPVDLINFVLQLPGHLRFDRIWVSCSAVDNSTRLEVKFYPEPFYEASGLFALEEIEFHAEYLNLTLEKADNPYYKRTIAVKFHNLPVGKDIDVECSVWAKNIPPHLSSVQFTLNVS